MTANLKIQWFPGHMTKARRMMEEQIKLVDVVVEMLDARIPLSSTNPMLAGILGEKPRVIAFNKVDLADKEKTEVWIHKFKNRSLPVCEVDCATGRGIKQLVMMVQATAKPVIDKWLKKGLKRRSIRVMIVGVPNVGKSTLINRLAGRNKTVTADRPGVTRGQQWIMIAKGLELLDTPGVLWPKFEDSETGFCLAVTGAIREDVFDKTQAAGILLERLMAKYPEELKSKYDIDFESGDISDDVMRKIAISRGCLKIGGLIDTDKAARMLLKDFRTGKVGRFTLEEP
ncbi:MAG: ribosome biogenesis GTPase YlqF [Phascolarctobacterium sp.]|nr:ribosome biogenesis GTPase YlqF [Phascolarctobacterium sp.]